MHRASVYNIDLRDVESGSSEQHLPPPIPPPRDYFIDEEAVLNEEEVRTERERQNKYFIRNRFIYLAIYAVLFCFCGSWWFTTVTFKVFPRAIGPSPDIAEKALEDIRTGPSKVGEMWEQCIRDEGDRCYNETILAHDAEAARVSAIHASNQVKLEQASMMQTHCDLTYSDVETALRDWVLAGDTLSWKDMCPSVDRDIILKAAGGEIRQGQEEIFGLVARMSDENRQQLSVITTFLEDYARYNRDYFFGRLNVLEGTVLAQIGDLVAASLNGISLIQVKGFDGFNGVITCISPVQGYTCRIPSIGASLNVTLDTFDFYLELSHESVQQALMVIATLVERYDWAVDNLEEFVRIFQGLRSVLGRPFDLALNSLGGIDLGKFVDIAPGRYFVPDGIDLPEFGELPSFQPALTDLRDEIRRLQSGVLNLANQISDELRDKVDELVKNVMLSFASVLDDYDPPKYPGFNSSDLGGVIGEFDSRSEKYRTQFERAVQDLKLIRTTTADLDPKEFVVEEIDLDTVESYRENAPDLLGIQLPTVPHFFQNVYRWFDDRYFLLDILLRLWMIISRFLRFYHRSAVPTPKIVVGSPGTDSEEQEDQQRQEQKPWWLKLLDTVFSRRWILVGLVVLVTLFLAGSGYTLNLYIKHYQGSCVALVSGTAIAQRVILPALHDPAKLDGNIARRQENSKLNTQQTRLCSSLGATSRATHRQQEERLFSIRYDYNSTIIESTRILDCVDLPELGANGAQLHQDISTCSLPLDIALDDGVSNCDWQRCEFDCDQRKITEDITKVVIENSCIYEWYLLSDMIILFLKLFQYWSIWFSAFLVENAIFIFFRTYLRPDTVKWVYEEDMERRHIVGAEDMTLEEAKAKARVAHRRWEIILASFELFLAIAINVLWIYARIKVARSDDFLMPKWL